MGALLLAGEKRKRYALPHSRIMIHQPLGGFQEQATDIEIPPGDSADSRKAQQDPRSSHRSGYQAHRFGYRP